MQLNLSNLREFRMRCLIELYIISGALAACKCKSQTSKSHIHAMPITNSGPNDQWHRCKLPVAKCEKCAAMFVYILLGLHIHECNVNRWWAACIDMLIRIARVACSPLCVVEATTFWMILMCIALMTDGLRICGVSLAHSGTHPVPAKMIWCAYIYLFIYCWMHCPNARIRTHTLHQKLSEQLMH